MTSPGERLLLAARRAVADEIPELVDKYGHELGALSAQIYLIDLDQRVLVPLGSASHHAAEPTLPVDATLAGRAFRTITLLEGLADDGLTTWVPLVDGVERLGVLRFSFPADATPAPIELHAFAVAVADLIVTKRAYGDYFSQARRTKPLTVAAELLWQLLPPLTFGTPDVVITGAFIPTADLGGDAFDYAVDGSTAYVSIFDGMGHGLQAGLLATVAMAANRNARRSRLELADMASAIGEQIAASFPDQLFVTGVVATLDLVRGRFSWCVAGHPAPLLLRQGRAIKHLDPGVGMPFGMGPVSDVFAEDLEPGDRILLYTDGITDAMDEEGVRFGVDRLVDLIGKVGGEEAPPETMRRLMHAIEDYNFGPMPDDATVVMIEWRGPGSARVQPS